MDSGGVINISGWINEEELFLSVRDNGCGIPGDKISEILSHSAPTTIGCRNVGDKLKLIYGPRIRYPKSLPPKTEGRQS